MHVRELGQCCDCQVVRSLALKVTILEGALQNTFLVLNVPPPPHTHTHLLSVYNPFIILFLVSIW